MRPLRAATAAATAAAASAFVLYWSPWALGPAQAYERALLEYRQGAFAESIQTLEPARPSEDSPALHQSLLLEARALVQLGRLDEAKALLETELPSFHLSPAVETDRLFALSETYLRSGAFDNAQRTLREAEGMAESVGIAEAARLHVLRGQLLGRQGRFGPSQQEFESARRLADTAKDGLTAGEASNGLGMLLLIRSRYEEALPFFERAFRQWNEVGADHDAFRAANNLGICYSRLGNFEEAIKYRQEALERVQQSAGLGDVLGETGSLYMLQQEPAEAIPYYRRALAAAIEYQNQPGAARWSNNLASALIATGDFDAAEEANNQALSFESEPRSRAFLQLNGGLIAKARGRLEEAEAVFDRVLASAGDDPSVRWETRAALATLHLDAGEVAEANANFEAAIDVVESSQADLSHSEHKITFLARLISFYQEYVDALMEQGRYEQALAVADSSRARILSERLGAKHEASQRLTGAAFRTIARRSQATWLSYWIAPRRSFLWVVGPDSIEWFELPPAADVAQLVEQYQGFIETALRHPLEQESAAGRRLYESLLAPVQDRLPADARIVVTPDGPLHQLNLETLPIYGDRAHFWIEDAVVAVAPSFGVFESLPARITATGDKVLIIGDPLSEDPAYPRLSHAAAEVAMVSERFSALPQNVHTGAEATPAAYRAAASARFSVVHLAAHAEANRRSPLDSAIILAPDESGSRLYARDLVDIPLAADLITISACRSSGARTYAGEGLVGFTWTFMQAGARSVVAGLWEVGDRSTSMLMDRLYSEIAAGRPPVEALREAKLSLLHGDYSKPWYWGPFQIYVR